MRGFSCKDATVWPVFKWSFDGLYFARQGNGLISVYETETFGLLDKKSIQVNEIKYFSWSPGENRLAYWLPEVKENPSRVTVLEIPSRKEIRMKNLFNVSHVRAGSQIFTEHIVKWTVRQTINCLFCFL
jgi:translation initiation factor 3 subunit B